MSEKGNVTHEIIIVRRAHGGDHDDHHGGVWKVAFADFMTAMMAFFLVLWIVNSTSKETRSSIARYFNPLQLSNTTPARKGLKNADDSSFDAAASDQKSAPTQKAQKEPAEKEEHKSDKSKDQKAAKEEPKDSHKAADKEKEKKKADPKAAKEKSAEDTPNRLTRLLVQPGPVKPDEQPDNRDHEFSWTETRQSQAAPAPAPGNEYRDPFKPLRPTVTRQTISGPSTKPADNNKPPDQPAIRQSQTAQADDEPAKSTGEPAENPKMASAISGPQSASAPAQQMQQSGQATKPSNQNAESEKGPSGVAGAQGEAAQKYAAVRRVVEQLAKQLDGPEVQVKVIKEGILISLMDRSNVSMFEVNTPVLRPQTVALIGKLSGAIRSNSDPIVIQGHTDGRPFRSTHYNNWLLSAARAEQTRALLVKLGIREDRFERIEGYADRKLHDPKHKYAAENRRIDILLRQ